MLIFKSFVFSGICLSAGKNFIGTSGRNRGGVIRAAVVPGTAGATAVVRQEGSLRCLRSQPVLSETAPKGVSNVILFSLRLTHITLAGLLHSFSGKKEASTGSAPATFQLPAERVSQID